MYDVHSVFAILVILIPMRLLIALSLYKFDVLDVSDILDGLNTSD